MANWNPVNKHLLKLVKNQLQNVPQSLLFFHPYTHTQTPAISFLVLHILVYLFAHNIFFLLKSAFFLIFLHLLHPLILILLYLINCHAFYSYFDDDPHAISSYKLLLICIGPLTIQIHTHKHPLKRAYKQTNRAKYKKPKTKHNKQTFHCLNDSVWLKENNYNNNGWTFVPISEFLLLNSYSYTNYIQTYLHNAYTQIHTSYIHTYTQIGTISFSIVNNIYFLTNIWKKNIHKEYI